MFVLCELSCHECRIYRNNVVYCNKIVPKESPTHNNVDVFVMFDDIL